jgi:murein DD-endopeptidase MepM/ murein hydrolase activator NlpD
MSIARVADVSRVVIVKKAGLWLAVLAALCGTLAPAAGAATSSSQRQQAIDAELRRLRNEVGEMSEQQAALIAELKVSQRTRQTLDAKVASLDAAIATAEQELASVNTELEAAVAAERAADAALADARYELHESTSVLKEQAVQAFIHFGQKPSLGELLRDVEDVNDAPRITAYVQAVAETQGAVVIEHKQMRRATEQFEFMAARARNDVATRQQDVIARKSALEAARAEQASARAEVAEEAATEQRLLNAVQAKKSEYLRQINQLQAESNEIGAQLRRRQSGGSVTPSGRGVVGFPVGSPVITSGFGYRVHPIYGDRRLHTGVDFSAATGTPVYSGGGGVVVFAGWKSGYGNTVVIDHGGSLATLYAHNSALAVATGATVKRGQRIASAGSTGNSTGPHVHFEVRIKGTPVDPMSYL